EGGTAMISLRTETALRLEAAGSRDGVCVEHETITPCSDRWLGYPALLCLLGERRCVCRVCLDGDVVLEHIGSRHRSRSLRLSRSGSTVKLREWGDGAGGGSQRSRTSGQPRLGTVQR